MRGTREKELVDNTSIFPVFEPFLYNILQNTCLPCDNKMESTRDTKLQVQQRQKQRPQHLGHQVLSPCVKALRYIHIANSSPQNRRSRKRARKDKHGLRAWVLERMAFDAGKIPEGIKPKRTAVVVMKEFQSTKDSAASNRSNFPRVWIAFPHNMKVR
jgi:hypothetical protein